MWGVSVGDLLGGSSCVFYVCMPCINVCIPQAKFKA